jgi:hypothetical protein
VTATVAKHHRLESPHVGVVNLLMGTARHTILVSDQGVEGTGRNACCVIQLRSGHCQLNEKIPDKLVKSLTFDLLNR